MSYAAPGSGLGSAQAKKAEASLRMKQSLSRSADYTPSAAEALELKKERDAIHAEHLAAQARLKAQYDARPKPTPPSRHMTSDEIVRMVNEEIFGG